MGMVDGRGTLPIEEGCSLLFYGCFWGQKAERFTKF